MVTATNYKQCLALEVPAFVAFYGSRADFVGVDVLTLEVKFPNGKAQVQRIIPILRLSDLRLPNRGGRWT
jgi:hypothetical protein